MFELPLLSLLIFVPLIGAATIMLMVHEGPYETTNARSITGLSMAVSLFLTLLITMQFDMSNGRDQMAEYYAWISNLGIGYHVAVDGLSLSLIWLTVILMPICLIFAHSVTTRTKEFMVALLLLQTMLVGTFAARDLIVFYVFFEAVLIPMYLIIGIWGGEKRIYASYKFFLYTLLGSVLMLIAFLFLAVKAGGTDFALVSRLNLTSMQQNVVWLAVFASFAVKVPMWPLHTWLPDAHVQAPTVGSMVLAGVLLKLGGYGFLKISLPILPQASVHFADLVYWLSVVAIIYTALVAFVQKDIKKIIAYSSVSHMGFVTIGLFTMTQQGIEGAMMQMLSHGIISAGLFMGVGVISYRTGQRDIALLGGLVKSMPIFTVLMMILTLGSVGLPGTSGFVGEFLTLVGAYMVHVPVAVLAAIGVILSAAYMLRFFKLTFFGEPNSFIQSGIEDLNARELICFLPLVAGTLVLGIYPELVLQIVRPSVEELLTQIAVNSAS